MAVGSIEIHMVALHSDLLVDSKALSLRIHHGVQSAEKIAYDPVS